MQSFIRHAQENPNFLLDSEQLPKVEEKKDLGVTLSSKLLWDM
jgi:hypothetical protein